MNLPTPDFSTPDLGLRNLGLKSSWLKSLGLKSLGLEGSCLKSPGLESSWLRSLGLKGLGLKLEVEKSGVEMSFNPKHYNKTPPLDKKHARGSLTRVTKLLSMYVRILKTTFVESFLVFSMNRTD